MKTRWLLPALLALPFANSPAAEEVSLQLYNLSVRFHQASYTDFLGLEYTSQISSFDVVPPNGELFLLPPGEPRSHGGYLFLEQPQFPGEYIISPLWLDIPQFVDHNTNELHDFFETSQPVASTTTDGFIDDFLFGEIPIEATWSRAAGTKDGTCVLVIPDYGLEFEHAIEILEYKGPFNYTVDDTNRTGTVSLTQTGAPGNTLDGPAQLAVLDDDTAEISDGTWTNATGLAFPFSAYETLVRSGPNYTAFFYLDGAPDTSDQDYIDWFLMLVDERDSNGNGIPDFTDPAPPAPAPTVSINLDNDQVRLLIEGQNGSTYDLLESMVVPGNPWTVRETVTLTNDMHILHLPRPSNPVVFWQLRAP